jgi:Protein of unknown function (DUF2786)
MSDSKTESLTPAQLSKIKYRIRSMLNTSGRTPEEAKTYEEKAHQLMNKYNLTLADVQKATKPTVQPQPEPKKPEPKAKKAKAKTTGGKRGPAPTYRDDQTIVVLVSNPKRPGTQAFARYAHYKTGMTIAEALAAGLRRDDFRWDVFHGHIQIN